MQISEEFFIQLVKSLGLSSNKAMLLEQMQCLVMYNIPY